MSSIRIAVLLGIASLQVACFEDPNEMITIGSCRGERPNEPGIIDSCEEWFESRSSRDTEAENCKQRGLTWSDEPCPTENACGCCVEERTLSTRTTCSYRREDEPISEQVLQESCEDDEGDSWVDNPDVSCE